MYFGDIFRQGILEFFADASVGNNCKDTKTDAGKRADQIVNPAGNPADNVRVTSFSNNTYFHKLLLSLFFKRYGYGIALRSDKISTIPNLFSSGTVYVFNFFIVQA